MASNWPEGIARLIEVNGWCFCEAHGSEYCMHCFYDHRMTNNAQFEDELDEEESEAIDLQVRNYILFVSLKVQFYLLLTPCTNRRERL